ncbi:MAG: GumC family protein [Thermodesulfobacteriota bacterium]
MEGENSEEKIDLRDYMHVIQKRKWTVIMVFAIIVATVTIHAFTSTPIYEATTRLIIEKENPNMVSFQEAMSIDAFGTDYYQTQYKIIESRGVAKEVINKLRLNENEEFIPKPQKGILSAVKQTVETWKHTIASLLRSGPQNTIQDSEEEKPSSNLMEEFTDRIEVNPVRNSRLVDVGFKAKDPVLAANVANVIADVYIDQNLETRINAVQDAVKWLYDRIEEERRKVEKAELDLLRYKEKHSIVTDFSSDVEKITAQKLAQLNTQVVEAESKRVEAETRFKQAMALVDTPDMLDSIPEVLNNELIRQIKSMEVELYKRVSELSKKYGQKHPKMVAIAAELKTLSKRKAQEVSRVVKSLKSEYLVALARENSLKSALAQQKKDLLDLNQKAIEYGVLRREAEGAREMYEMLIKRFKEASITEDMKTGNIRVIDEAEVPESPIRPRKRLNILLAVILSLFIGIGLAFFFEYLDNTVKVPEDIREHIKIPYLGLTPLFSTNDKTDFGREVSPELITFRNPMSTASESYRGIRTNIFFSSAESVPHAILITSAGSQEGKTIVSSNLAITMAQIGSQVIILDCDMRKPRVHKVFGITKSQGISNLLTGNGTLKEAISRTGIPHLDVIPCGPIPPNPAEMLGSGRMAMLLKALRKHYAYIIIDSPPSTAVTDAGVISKWVDGVILVVRAGYLSREVIRNGVAQFEAVGSSILGAILNGVNMEKDGYHYYQYYYSYYGNDEERKSRSRLRRKK